MSIIRCILHTCQSDFRLWIPYQKRSKTLIFSQNHINIPNVKTPNIDTSMSIPDPKVSNVGAWSFKGIKVTLTSPNAFMTILYIAWWLKLILYIIHSFQLKTTLIKVYVVIHTVRHTHNNFNHIISLLRCYHVFSSYLSLIRVK